LHREYDVSEPRTLERSIATLGPEATASLIAATADVALLIDETGVIRDVNLGGEGFVPEGHRKWIGRTWAETVTVESKAKVQELLHDAGKRQARRWRQVNHPGQRGPDLPVLYSAIPVGREGSVVAIGRDLRAMAALQQQLIEAQQSMERDYLRLRHLETRYRLLFQMGSEPVVVVDAATQRVVEANPAAVRLIGESSRKLVGRQIGECFTVRTRPAVLALLTRVQSTGRTEEVEARIAGGQQPLSVSASTFRQDSGTMVLIRLSRPDGADTSDSNVQRSMLLRSLEALPDGFVVTDVQGRILTANAAFVELTQLNGVEPLRGQSLDRWLGRSGVDLSVLMTNLRQQGVVRLFATTMSGQHGGSTPVEISAVYVGGDEHSCLGFMVRDVGRRLNPGLDGSRELPRSVGDLTRLVGRVPLKDIVGETTDLIEKMCIEAALGLTHDNRASAAEMLGLSRQSLYVKLRRYGVGSSDE
jgi:transcriptional regulator PpsR